MENNSSDNIFHYSISVPVRYADCDILGHVNHAKMFTYMEEARANYLVDVLGMGFTASETNPTSSALLAEAKCTYKSPANFGDALLVKTRVLKLGRSSFVMDYEITKENDSRLVAMGETIGVFYDFKTQTSAPLSNLLREKIEKFEKKKF